MLSKVKNLIRWARVTKSSNDSESYPIQQLSFLGKVVNAVMLFPYGYHANLKPGSMAVLFSANGQEANRVAMGWTPDNRPKLSAGEVAVYHPDTGAIIHFKSNGDIDVTASGKNVNVNCDKANITADTSITVDTPIATFTGDVQIDGKLDVNGNITSLANVIATALLQGASLTITTSGGSITGALTNNGVNVGSTHVHGGVTTGAGNTGGPM